MRLSENPAAKADDGDDAGTIPLWRLGCADELCVSHRGGCYADKPAQAEGALDEEGIKMLQQMAKTQMTIDERLQSGECPLPRPPCSMHPPNIPMCKWLAVLTGGGCHG